MAALAYAPPPAATERALRVPAEDWHAAVEEARAALEDLDRKRHLNDPAALGRAATVHEAAIFLTAVARCDHARYVLATYQGQVDFKLTEVLAHLRWLGVVVSPEGVTFPPPPGALQAAWTAWSALSAEQAVALMLLAGAGG